MQSIYQSGDLQRMEWEKSIVNSRFIQRFMICGYVGYHANNLYAHVYRSKWCNQNKFYIYRWRQNGTSARASTYTGCQLYPDQIWWRGKLQTKNFVRNTRMNDGNISNKILDGGLLLSGLIERWANILVPIEICWYELCWGSWDSLKTFWKAVYRVSWTTCDKFRCPFLLK